MRALMALFAETLRVLDGMLKLELTTELRPDDQFIGNL